VWALPAAAEEAGRAADFKTLAGAVERISAAFEQLERAAQKIGEKNGEN
jgi:hypothetical protein